jgi:uncharacterized membrane protein YqhA
VAPGSVSSRFVVIVAVRGTFVGALTLVALRGRRGDPHRARDRPRRVSSEAVKTVTLGFIEATDVFLIGIVLFIIAMGLYALFVDDTLSWVRS